MTRWKVFKGAALLLLLGVLGGVVLVSGVVPIRASSGHWAITAAVLQFAKSRSVSTHSLGTSVTLNSEGVLLKGAGQYVLGCQPCHGSVEKNAFARTVQGMTPTPPYLPPRISRWSPEELFHIVKHGIKFTGMPAFPSLQRDDEVEAVVAFMLKLPTPEADRLRARFANVRAALTPDGQAPPPVVVSLCASCHGGDGGGQGVGAFPKLAGQRRAYLRDALEAYATGARHSGIMEPLAVALTAEEREAIADYYAALPPVPGNPPADEALLERGRAIAQGGITEQRVPACSQCHGPKPSRVNPHYPTLSGQYADYLVLQLKLFKQGTRGGARFAELMHPVAPRLDVEQMEAVAHYYASLPPDASR